MKVKIKVSKKKKQPAVLKSWFATLQRTKLYCSKCLELARVKKYLGEGKVELDCLHVRHARASEIVEVEAILDGRPLA